MKKLALPLLILVALAASVAFFLLRHSTRSSLAPAELLPAGTLAYAEVTDFRRTRERWMHTALRQLWLEPEVQSFLQQPLATLPQLTEGTRYVRQLEQLQPRQAFVALTSMDGNNPRFVAGLAFSGDRATLDTLLSEPRAKLHQAYPAGKSDLIQYQQTEIQTFTAGELVIAESVREGWYFVANDLSTLKALLDRATVKTTDGKGTLAQEETFRATLHPLPTDAEILGFLRMEPLVGQLSALVAASGQSLDAATMAEWKKRRGLAFASRIEGQNFKDSLFVYAPGSEVESKLPLAGLALTSPETLLYYDTALSPGLLAQLMAMAKTAGADLSSATPLLHLLGPEMSFALDWPSTAEVNGVLAIPVSARADGLPETLDKIGTALSWTKTQENGATLYTGHPMMGLEALVPAATLTRGFLVAGLPKTLFALAQKPAGPTLATAPAYQGVLKDLPEPTGTFAFLNTSALADRLYGTVRPALAMALAFNPTTMPYLDASKLPSAPVLVKHLGATSISRSTSTEGQLLISQGPLTLPQLGLLFLGGGAAAFPALRDSLPPGLVPPGLLSLPGSSAPVTPAGPH